MIWDEWEIYSPDLYCPEHNEELIDGLCVVCYAIDNENEPRDD